jgi:hypothetical protein
MVDCHWTEYALAERCDPSELAEQIQQVSAFIGPSNIINLLPQGVLVLNQNRQIVFANRIAHKLLESGKSDSIYGLRPGELLDCLHASESPGGCGATKFCSACGAVKAILNGLKGEESVEECHLIQKKSGNALDLRVWVFPLGIAGQVFDLFYVTNISDEKRRNVLERIFFHDILNTATGIYGFTDLLGEVSQAELKECREHLHSLSRQLIDEIITQRDLMKAENYELTVNFKPVEALHFLTGLAALYSGHEEAIGKKMVIAPDSQEVTFSTDTVLLARVLGNMLKNALEASELGETVTMGCEIIERSVRFQVHNPAFIRPEIQLQIFLRSFSTKGSNRGLGTYSMRLLSERYLKGKVWFTSSREDGTRFYASYPL